MIFKIILLAAIIAMIVKFFLVQIGAPSWSYYVTLPILAAILYVINASLIKSYIEKHAPDFASTKKISDDMQKWELTAGTGVVPKWVSWIGLSAIASLLALIFPFFASLFR
jgi:hypothetical protein